MKISDQSKICLLALALVASFVTLIFHLDEYSVVTDITGLSNTEKIITITDTEFRVQTVG